MCVVCKSLRNSLLVLIYPYWNVNADVMRIRLSAGTVLIYPYWNVNVVAIVQAGQALLF